MSPPGPRVHAVGTKQITLPKVACLCAPSVAMCVMAALWMPAIQSVQYRWQIYAAASYAWLACGATF